MSDKKFNLIAYQPNKENAEVASIVHDAIYNFLDNEVEEFENEESAFAAYAEFIRQNPHVAVTGEVSRDALVNYGIQNWTTVKDLPPSA